MGVLRLMIQPAGGAPSSVGFDQPQVKLGRSSQCEIRLPFQIVSGHHLTFLNEKGDYKVIDVGSTNGTHLNGVRLEPHVPTLIRSGHVLQIVDLTIRIEIESLLCEGFTLAESTIMLRQMMSEALTPKNAENRETAFLEFSGGLGKGRRVMLPDDLENGWIGSAADSLVHVNHPMISARIGEIKRNGDGYGIELVEGCGELIHVNGSRCLALHPLRSGDRISIGNAELTFHDPLEAHLAALDLQRPVATAVQEESALVEPAKADEPDELPQAKVIQDLAVQDKSGAGPNYDDTQTDAPVREPLGVIELGLIALSGLLMLAGLVLFLYVLEII